jgi:hypothetical protein
MAEQILVVKFTDGVQIPYVAQAESQLDPLLKTQWDVVAASFPFLTLSPLYDLEPAVIQNMLDGISAQGIAPPDLLKTFTTPAPEELVEQVAAALGALPFVEYAEVSGKVLPAIAVHHGDDPLFRTNQHLFDAPFILTQVFK